MREEGASYCRALAKKTMYGDVAGVHCRGVAEQ